MSNIVFWAIESAVRPEQRNGDDHRVRSSFSLAFTYMEFESRSTDLGGQIFCAMSFLPLAASRWQVALQGRKEGSFISWNKVRTGGSKLELSDQVQLHVVYSCIAAVLQWRKPNVAMVGSTAASSNKVCAGSLFFYSSCALLLLLASHGGLEKELGGALDRGSGGDRGSLKQQFGEDHMAARCPCWHSFNLHPGGPSPEQRRRSSPSLPQVA
jgi:hypothetical protein